MTRLEIATQLLAGYAAAGNLFYANTEVVQQALKAAAMLLAEDNKMGDSDGTTS